MFPCEIYHYFVTISNMSSGDILNWIKSDIGFYGPIFYELYKKTKKREEDKKKLMKSIGAEPFIPQYKRNTKFEQETGYMEGQIIPINIGSVDIGYLLHCGSHWAMISYIPQKCRSKFTMDTIEKFPGYVIDDGSYGLITWVHCDKQINISQAICEVWEAREFIRVNV